MEGRLWTYRDIARETTLSESTVRRLMREGRFPRPRPLLSGRVVFLEDEVRAAVATLLASSAVTERGRA